MEKKLDLQDEFAKQDSSADGLSTTQAKHRLEEVGPNSIEEKRESRFVQFLKTFWGPIPWMIEAAAVLSLVIKHWADFSIITTMLVLNSIIEFLQSSQAQNALDALKASLALTARVKRDGAWNEVKAADIVPGDIVQLANGDIIPADVVLADGEYLSVDQAALTGESLPVNKEVGMEAYSGSIVKQGSMVAMVRATGSHTFFGKTAGLVQSAGTISRFQKSIISIGKFLIIAALALSAVIIANELFRHSDPLKLIELVLVLIVASIPVAMPAVLSVTLALGATALSKKKAIVSRLRAIEEMAGVNILCSDKTGTLTMNSLTLGEPLIYGSFTTDDAYRYAALACDANGDDAIDGAILSKASDTSVADYHLRHFHPFDPVSKRSGADLTGPDGKVLTVWKGAPKAIIDLCSEGEEILSRVEADVEALGEKGQRALCVAVSDGGNKMNIVATLSLFDPPREDSRSTIDAARAAGIEVRMVTGDDVAIAREVSSELDLGTNIQSAEKVFAGVTQVDHLPAPVKHHISRAEGFARVFPEHKYAIVKTLQEEGHIVAMTGDGVNDAPALKQADIGIAVSGATDAARSAADLILTLPGLSVIISAVSEAKKIFQRMISYVHYRVAMTINIMLFVTLAIVFTGVEPLSAIMIILLALLDDIPIMTIAYDRTLPPKRPMTWDLNKVLTISAVLGIVSVFQNFGLLHLADKFFGSTAEVQSMIFLELVVAGHLLLFVARQEKFFWQRPLPSGKLLLAVLGTQIVAVLLVRFGIFVPAISWKAIGFVWLYSLIWMPVLSIVRMITEKSIDERQHHKRFKLLNQHA